MENYLSMVLSISVGFLVCSAAGLTYLYIHLFLKWKLFLFVSGRCLFPCIDNWRTATVFPSWSQILLWPLEVCPFLLFLGLFSLPLSYNFALFHLSYSFCNLESSRLMMVSVLERLSGNWVGWKRKWWRYVDLT